MGAREYQKEVIQKTNELWKYVDNVMLVLPTGAGKTYCMASILKQHVGHSCIIAHRTELVEQISLALAKQGVLHRIIAPTATVRAIVRKHISELGTTFFNTNAPAAVAGVDTLTARAESLAPWAANVSLWMQDEAHHVLAENKWGKAASMFPRAKGLGVTATPERADGKGLGRDFDGVMDQFVIGPTARDLIEDGYLTDYKIYCPPNDLDLSQVKVSSSTGDYVQQALKKAVQRSKIMGNIIDHYKKQATDPTDSGITFVPSVDIAAEESVKFNEEGVPCEVVSAKTPSVVRNEIIARFKKGDSVKQLINVDLFGEGFDLPALRIVSFARPTQSYSLYCQQFGRALRPVYADGYDLSTREGRLAAIANGPKPYAIVVDHVGNVMRHGLPDAPREWTLAAREKRSSSKKLDGEPPLRICTDCTQPYEAITKICPYCGWEHIPAQRTSPEFVDGDLEELSPEVLRAMRGDVERMDRSDEDVWLECAKKNMPKIGRQAAINRHHANQASQKTLRETIAQWAGNQRALGRKDSESYRRFYFKFGIDVMSAQALGEKEAEILNKKILTLQN